MPTHPEPPASPAVRGDAAGRLRAVTAVLFDMDGTLVDSDLAVERAWLAWADAFGVDRDLVRDGIHGSPAEVTVRRLLPELSDAEVRAAAQYQLDLQYDDGSASARTEGVADILDALGAWGVPWAIVTSADETLARVRLDGADLRPPLLVTADHVERGKPDPSCYLLAAHRLGVDPSACLVVEDSDPGLVAGSAAGAVTAALRGLDGDVRIAHVGQLVEVLAAAGLGERCSPATQG
ncbi:MAG: HAD-IA family hydrolase [Actinomycetota bacterium]|nr:HAD-IA family hydrolase [Actinomycetota bacterium]